MLYDIRSCIFPPASHIFGECCYALLCCLVCLNELVCFICAWIVSSWGYIFLYIPYLLIMSYYFPIYLLGRPFSASLSEYFELTRTVASAHGPLAYGDMLSVIMNISTALIFQGIRALFDPGLVSCMYDFHNWARSSIPSSRKPSSEQIPPSKYIWYEQVSNRSSKRENYREPIWDQETLNSYIAPPSPT